MRSLLTPYSPAWGLTIVLMGLCYPSRVAAEPAPAGGDTLAPELILGPTGFASSEGVVVEFETSVPTEARLYAGTETTFDTPDELCFTDGEFAQRHSIAGSGVTAGSWFFRIEFTAANGRSGEFRGDSPSVCSDCSREPGDERLVRQYFNVLGSAQEEWRPESAMPPEPQKRPFNVVWEVTRYPHAEPTRAQRQKADSLVALCFQAAERKGWFDYETGLRDGYQLQVHDDNHHYNWEYLVDGVILDPERPEYLMYYETANGRELLGFMFLVAEPLQEGPQLGGPLTLWHYHIFSRPVCYREGLLPVGDPLLGPGAACAEGTPQQRSPEMLHVWLVDRPGGPFATPMAIDPKLIPELVKQRF